MSSRNGSSKHYRTIARRQRGGWEDLTELLDAGVNPATVIYRTDLAAASAAGTTVDELRDHVRDRLLIRWPREHRRGRVGFITSRPGGALELLESYVGWLRGLSGMGSYVDGSAPIRTMLEEDPDALLVVGFLPVTMSAP